MKVYKMYDEDEVKFTYTVEQTRLSDCQRRINGLVKNSPDAKNEIARLNTAYADIVSRISKEDLAALFAHENLALTPEQAAAAAKKASTDMDANRDKPSI